MKLATLCYLRRDGHTLMLHRTKKPGDYHQGKWNGLGGKLRPGESPEECLHREVLEESGLTVEAATLRGLITFPNFDGIDDWYCFIYTVEQTSGQLSESPEGELRWIPDRELLSLNLWEGDRVFIPWLFQDKLFSAKFIYEQGEFKSYQVTFY
ncbi:MAG: 8-oxo-dGTP diphosphatase [Truepera sp.]|nr:8-oxo-dGTP diphosphatase [Truepera sp.]